MLKIPLFRYVDDLFSAERPGCADHCKMCIFRLIRALLGPSSVQDKKVCCALPLPILGVTVDADWYGAYFWPSEDKVTKSLSGWHRYMKLWIRSSSRQVLRRNLQGSFRGVHNMFSTDLDVHCSDPFTTRVSMRASVQRSHRLWNGGRICFHCKCCARLRGRSLLRVLWSFSVMLLAPQADWRQWCIHTMGDRFTLTWRRLSNSWSSLSHGETSKYVVSSHALSLWASALSQTTAMADACAFGATMLVASTLLDVAQPKHGTIPA